MKHPGICLVVTCCIAGLVGCGGGTSNGPGGDFTKIDSLTETYLALQDTMLQSWNVMVNDENEKIRSMHELLHTLLSLQHYDKDQLISLEKRLEELKRIRFTQKTMSDPHSVEEYDFASNSLISEIISLTESDLQFSTSNELQTLVDQIRTADQRVNTYRSDYDMATTQFNRFLEKYQNDLKEIDQNSSPQKRPLFQMAGNQ